MPPKPPIYVKPVFVCFTLIYKSSFSMVPNLSLILQQHIQHP